MAVSEEDVRRIAELARLGLVPGRIPELVRELNGILDHMDVLSAADTTGVDPALASWTPAAPLRPDDAALREPIDVASFAPATKEGFFIVPRLASHEGE